MPEPEQEEASTLPATFYHVHCDTESSDHYDYFFREQPTKRALEKFIRAAHPCEFEKWNGEEHVTIYWHMMEVGFDDD